MIDSVEFAGVPSMGVIYEPDADKTNVAECRKCEPSKITTECHTKDTSLDDNVWSSNYMRSHGKCNNIPHEWNWQYKNCGTIHDRLPPNLEPPWAIMNDPNYKFRTTTGSVHNQKYYHSDLHNERRPKARPAADYHYNDSLHLKLQALSSRVPLNTQTRNSEYRTKYTDVPNGFPRDEKVLSEYLKDLDTMPKFKEPKSVFTKEDKDIPFAGLSKAHEGPSVSKLLNPYNTIYDLAYRRYTNEERKKYRPQNYKEDALPSLKPKVQDLPIYGPDKERGMKDPSVFSERRHFKHNAESCQKSYITLPCIAYKTEYNSKFKDHPQLCEITHAGEIQPCCQQKKDYVVKKVEPAIQLEQRKPKRYVTETMEISGGKQFDRNYKKCDDCYCGNLATEARPYIINDAEPES